MVPTGHPLIGHLDALVLAVVTIVSAELGRDTTEAGALHLDLGTDGFITVRVIEVVSCGGA